MTPFVNTVVVGGGQAGLAVSHYLTDHAINHVVLEQADRPADAWRNRRWDSFTLNTPRWQSRVPGVRYGDDDPDGFMPKHEVVAHLDELARRLPVRTRARVTNIRRYGGNGCYVIKTSEGETISAHNVVVATGLYQSPKIPALAQDLPSHIKQLHSDTYRNPDQLLPGAVLVVGSAQSGAQIAEELYESGRKVYLATGRAGRTPRRYRGKDANWWFARMGQYDRKVSELPSPKASFPASRTSPAPRAATPSIFSSSRATVSPCSGVLRASKATSSGSRATCTTIWPQPTEPKRSSSRPWIATSPAPACRPPQRRYPCCVKGLTRES